MLRSVESTLNYCMDRKNTIVFGNLGRDTQLIAEYFQQHYPQLNIVVVSKYYTFPQRDHVVVSDTLLKCDLLLYIEPAVDSVISEFDLASRTIIFTSHACLTIPPGFTEIDFYKHILTGGAEMEMNCSNTLVNLQDAAITHRVIDVVKERMSEQLSAKVLSKLPEADYTMVPGRPFPEFAELAAGIILDLTSCETVTELFLTLLDLYDVLKWNTPRVARWVICFPEKMESRFKKFTQRFIDKMICKTRGVFYLKMTPFFKLPPSLAIEEMRDVPAYQFCGYNFYLPENVRQACLANTHLDLIAFSDKMYIQKKVAV